MSARTEGEAEGALAAQRNCWHCAAQTACPVTRLRGDLMAKVQLREHRFRAGDVLQAQGSISTALRIIKSGTVMMCCALPPYGGHRSIGVLGRGTVTGQFGLLGRASPVTHIGILEGRYCELSNAALRSSGLLEDPAFLWALQDFMAHAMEQYFSWSMLRSGDSVTRQLAGALLHLSELQCSLRVRLPTQTVLADLLGTTRESITRAFARLEKNGDVSRCGRHYCDLHMPRLLERIQAPDPSLPH
ncbi:MAG: Crp/Fnr family transcriptional regulator [Comamonas sp.]|uniref:Crp/Fnr family transcriptional regulator n=1 Tax=Comamonas sp. TaxID=34028 RepID=UPI002FC5F705